eukprot:5330463-Alexandrium_andersonii.AAC.1
MDNMAKQQRCFKCPPSPNTCGLSVVGMPLRAPKDLPEVRHMMPNAFESCRSGSTSGAYQD